MIGSRRRSWPDFCPCNSTNCVAAINDSQPLCISSPKANSTSEFILGRKHDSVVCCPAWSLNSFMAINPSSPSQMFTSFSPLSDISCSPNSDFFYSQISSTVFSTPRNKSSCWSVDEKLSVSSTEEIDEEMNNLINLNAVYMQNRDSKEEEVVEEDHNAIATKCLSYCTTEYKSFDARQPFVVLPSQLPILVVNEEEEEGQVEKRGRGEEEEVEEKVDNGVSRSSIEESEISESSSINGHQRLITRPKPYHAFLHEIKNKEVAEKANAWKEAKHLKLLNKLKRKEAAIDAWELQQTKKATLRMKKIECKLERKRAKAMQNMHKAISSTHKKAEEKKAKEKHTTLDKISKISRVTEKMKVTRSKVGLKVLRMF